MPRAKIPDSTRVNVIVPNQTLKIAKFLASKRGTSYSDVIRHALTQHFREELLKETAADEKLTELGLKSGLPAHALD